MRISLENIGKRYNADWIFRKMNFEFEQNNNYVILGANGSGKSTLLQLIAGNQIPSEGKINYSNPDPEKNRTGKNGTGKNRASDFPIEAENFFPYISYAAPYLELIEEFTLREMIRFHFKFKRIINGFDESPEKIRISQFADKIIECCYLEASADKQLKNYSSGMKQRVRLALAILSDTPVLLLDEPCSNLDHKGVEWYNKLIDENKNDRLIIVCSNKQKEEYSFCNKEINVEEFKK